VTLGRGVVLKSHAIVTGWTEIGEETLIFPFANIGDIPQDLKYAGERTRLIVGARNRIREGVTMNTGTEHGGGVTRVGDDGLFMAGAHVAHDAQIGEPRDPGEQRLHRRALRDRRRRDRGGLSGVHQWVRVGRGAIIGAVTMVTNDVIPYGLVQGPRGVLDGLNLVGLKRRGVDRADITALRAAFQALAQGEGAFQDRARRLGESEEGQSDYVREIVEFVLGDTDRSYLTPG
jgi:UDP-N-acetylglucosamine acyltransferase